MFWKKYDTNQEKDIYIRQQKNFKTSHYDEGKNMTVSFPPPNVTWVLHLWHALTISIQDMIVRYYRMSGYRTTFIPGTDHAGIATQAKVEQKLFKEWIKKADLWRVDFLKHVRNFALENRGTIIEQMQACWWSFDWSKEAFTLSEKFSRAVRKYFVQMYRQWKIYRWSRVTNRDPEIQSVISDIEVEYVTQPWKLYYIKYFTKWWSRCLTVATTRPETIFGDCAIAVHPWDKRYKEFIGKTVLVPILNIHIPVIADEYVDPTFGTGALKITPAHDANDFEIWVRHNLTLDKVAINKEWYFTDICGEWFAWHKVVDFFDNVVQKLHDTTNLEKIEDYEVKKPISTRTWAEIQPLISKQRFYDTSLATNAVLQSIQSWETIIYPQRFAHTLEQWMSNPKPWCISRQLWWWHRIPVRYSDESMYVLDEDDITQKLWKILFNLIADSKIEKTFTLNDLNNALDMQCIVPQDWTVYDVYTQIFWYFDRETLHDDMIRLSYIHTDWDCYTFSFEDIFGSWPVNQDHDTFDTWFSSWLWPLATLWRPDDTADFASLFPQTLLETGSDIIFFWVARMMMMSREVTWKMPFESVYLHGMITDERWRKMSKSDWNGIDPQEVIAKYNTDGMRLALMMWSTPWNNVWFSRDKVDYASRFLTKLRNASRYIYTSCQLQEWHTINYHEIRESIQEINDFDKRILSWLDDMIKHSHDHMSAYRLWEYISDLIQFIWWSFCDRYIEISKHNTSSWTQSVLLYCIWTLCKLLYPAAPFITDALRHSLWFSWEVYDWYPEIYDVSCPSQTKVLMEIITHIRSLRADHKVPQHEWINAMILWPRHIQDFVLQYKDLLLALAKVADIYFEPQEWYHTSILYDMTIWVQYTQKIDAKQQLYLLQKQYDDEKRYADEIRSSINAPWFLQKAPESVILLKQRKLEESLITIDLLQLQISKIKAI